MPLRIYPLLLSVVLVLPRLSDTGLGVPLLVLAIVSGVVSALGGGVNAWLFLTR